MSRFSAFFRGRQLLHLRDLVRELVARDIKLRYKRSVLGIAWSLLTPLLQLLVFYLLFQVILALPIGRFSSFTLIGLLVWAWFQTSLSQSANAITGNRELIRRPGFRPAVLPVVTVTTNFIHFLLALPILLIVLVIDGSRLGPSLLTLPLVVILQFALTLSLAYLVASANVVFADTQHLVGVILLLLFFLSPIFYDANSVPEHLQPLYRLNPLVRLLDAYRAVLMEGAQPDWPSLVAPCLLAIGLLFVGYRFFAGMSYRFVDEL
jgi:lipopolysaccharide transport system permease protein